MDQEYYAHSLPGKLQKDWQRLEDHLQAVAEKARSFAEAFGGGGLSQDLRTESSEVVESGLSPASV